MPEPEVPLQRRCVLEITLDYDPTGTTAARLAKELDEFLGDCLDDGALGEDHAGDHYGSPGLIGEIQVASDKPLKPPEVQDA